MKLLLGYLQPKDIPEVLGSMARLPIDQLRVKYYTEREAYKKLQEYFLKQYTDYTHLVVVTNDVLVRPDHIVLLQETIAKYPDKVVCGVMNVDLHTDNWNITIDPVETVERIPVIEGYHWVKKNSVEGIVKVWFAGNPLMAYPREIVERIGFPVVDNAHDYYICDKLHRNNIDVMCDTRLVLRHLATRENLLVGIKEPEVVFISRGF